MDTKQVIVVNEGLKLPRGKLAAQVAHAAVSVFLEAGEEARRDWLNSGMTKIVLQVEHEADLSRLYDLARSRNIPALLISDAGRTVIPAGTVTCLGLGPAGVAELDALVGQLKLLR